MSLTLHARKSAISYTNIHANSKVELKALARESLAQGKLFAENPEGRNPRNCPFFIV
jgi:hypothetical protein